MFYFKKYQGMKQFFEKIIFLIISYIILCIINYSIAILCNRNLPLCLSCIFWIWKIYTDIYIYVHALIVQIILLLNNKDFEWWEPFHLVYATNRNNRCAMLCCPWRRGYTYTYIKADIWFLNYRWWMNASVIDYVASMKR